MKNHHMINNLGLISDDLSRLNVLFLDTCLRFNFVTVKLYRMYAFH